MEKKEHSTVSANPSSAMEAQCLTLGESFSLSLTLSVHSHFQQPGET